MPHKTIQQFKEGTSLVIHQGMTARVDLMRGAPFQCFSVCGIF